MLDLPAHLLDALWRVESAGLAPRRARPGSWSRAWAARPSAASWRARRSAAASSARSCSSATTSCRPGSTRTWTVLLSRYSGTTEETLACWDAADGGRRPPRRAHDGRRRSAERARADRVAVVPLPGGFQPRAAVGYSTVLALEVAAVAGVAPSLRDEVEAAAALLGDLAEGGGRTPGGRAAKVPSR